MAINVTTSKQQITASVAEDKISATVSSGFGATGPSGVINVTAPITNSGTTTAANVGLSLGSGLSVSGGSLVVTPGSYATLVGGKVPADQLPSYVDDVLEYANLASFPVTGETGKIYLAINTGKIFRWSGSSYFEISEPPASTDAVPEGAANFYFTNARAKNAFGTAATGQIIGWSGGQWTATDPAVASVNGKTGTVTISHTDVTAAAASHTHNASAIDAGTLNASRLPSNVVQTTTISGAQHITSGVAAIATEHPALAGGANPGDLTLLNLSYDAGSVFAIAADGNATLYGTGAFVCHAITLAGTDLASTLAGKAPVPSDDYANPGLIADGAVALWDFQNGTPWVRASDGVVLFDTGYAAAMLTAIGAASLSHQHGAADVTSGTFDIARIPTGTTSSTVCIGNDARLSDARTPTAHNQAWSTITSTPTTRSGYGITDAQKTITSGTAAPTGGSDGDIYLQYT